MHVSAPFPTLSKEEPREDVQVFLDRLRRRFPHAPLATSAGRLFCFPCPGCDVEFPSPELLLSHLRRVECPARACVGCGACYADRKSCEKHQSICKTLGPKF